MENLSTFVLVGIFSGGAIATWIAGVYLSRTTDALDFRWKFGEAIGGMILLSAVGSLPEVAITISAAAEHNLPLAAGAALARSGAVLADRFHVNGIVFGATILAAASALPEISTGIAAVRLGDHQLVMSDVFGGTPALPQSGVENGWLAAVGILLTTLYASSVIMRPAKRYLRLGLDSVVAILAFVIGIVGLMLIAH